MTICKFQIKELLFCICMITLLTGCGTSKNRVIRKAISNAEQKLGIDINRKDYFPLYLEVADWLGTPYRYGGNTKMGTDCSGFTSSIVKTAYGKKIERTTHGQLKKSVRRVRKASLQEGDLVFFTSKSSGDNAAHVGIYLKESKFAHASSSRGVIISDLDENYWNINWLCGGRIK